MLKKAMFAAAIALTSSVSFAAGIHVPAQSLTAEADQTQPINFFCNYDACNIVWQACCRDGGGIS